jgi:hypothetical protein
MFKNITLKLEINLALRFEAIGLMAERSLLFKPKDGSS